MLQQMVDNISQIKDINNPVILDLTFGMGGHSLSILKQYQNVRIVGTETDKRVLDQFIIEKKDEYQEVKDRLSIHNISYMDFNQIVDQYDGVIGDFGANSLHFDQKDWGFSYDGDAELDMRYNQQKGIKASQLIQNIDPISLGQLLEKYGELKDTHHLSKQIIEYRNQYGLSTATDLKDCIMNTKRNNYKTLVQVCQALRIQVNNELDNLLNVVNMVIPKLNQGGIGQFLTFHSLEHKIVKSVLRQYVIISINIIMIIIIIYNQKKQQKIKMNQRGQRPDETEIKSNNRCRSAQLYSFIRI